MQKKVLVLGDSHSSVFNLINDKKLISNYKFIVVDVGGATASGLENPNSRTNAYIDFEKALQEETHDYVITMLGEVDTGFVIWYRCERNEIGLDESLEKTINTYCSFLNKINANKIVISAPLPTIRDNHDWGELTNFRKDVKATQIERTNLTLEFNRKMQLFCEKNNIKFLNLDLLVLGNDGLLKEDFYSVDKNDHHYRKEVFAKLLEKNLRYVLQFKV